jgi:hypothetical protein
MMMLLMGEGDERRQGTESYDCKKVWSTINRSILYGWHMYCKWNAVSFYAGI